jgi:hypothetical protein
MITMYKYIIKYNYIINKFYFLLYRAINNYLDHKRRWKYKRMSKSRQAGALDARKYFRLHIPISI